MYRYFFTNKASYYEKDAVYDLYPAVMARLGSLIKKIIIIIEKE